MAVELQLGIGPSACGLQSRCSTDELQERFIPSTAHRVESTASGTPVARNYAWRWGKERARPQAPPVHHSRNTRQAKAVGTEILEPSLSRVPKDSTDVMEKPGSMPVRIILRPTSASGQRGVSSTFVP